MAKKNVVNNVAMQGYVFSTNRLELKTVKNQASANYGKEFIQGEVNLALDDNMSNVVPIHFSYVTATTKNGKPNGNFTLLKRLIDDQKLTVAEGGRENALKLHVDTALAVNDYLPKDSEEIVSVTRCDGGYMRELNHFDVDLVSKKNCDVIMQVIATGMKVNEDEGMGHVQVKGFTLSFRKELVPVTLDLYNERLASYLEGQGLSSKNPMAFQITTGSCYLNNANIVKNVEREQPWGEIIIEPTTERHHEIHVNTMNHLDDIEMIISAEELKTATQNREMALAEVKSRTLEYRKTAANNTVANKVAENKSDSSWDFDSIGSF